MKSFHKFFVGVLALTLGAGVAWAEELVFSNKDCGASSTGGYGNYVPKTLTIPELDNLPAGSKLRIKSVTFAAQVNNDYPTGRSAEFITINNVRSDSRTGLTSATEDWSIGKEMTFAFSESAIVTVGEPATMGIEQGDGLEKTLRIRLFKTTAAEYGYIWLNDSMDQWRPAYEIVVEVVERAKYLLRVDGVEYSSLEKAFATVGAEERKALEIVDTDRLVYDDGKLILDGSEVDLDEFAILLEEGEGGTFTVSRNPARMIFNGGEFLNPYALKGENGELLVYGTTNAYGDRTKEKVFDGDLSTYFDPAIASSDSEGSQWAGIGFENPVMITAIKFAVRSGINAQRINGCSIQGANEPDFSDAENIHLIEVDSFYDGAETFAELEDVHGPYKYVRIIGECCGNVAELKFYGLVDSGSDAPTTAPNVTDFGLTDDGRPTFTIVADASVPQAYRVERTMVAGDGDEEAFLPLGIRSGATKKWTAASPTPFTAYRVQGVNANGTSPWTTFTIAPDCPAGKPTFSVVPGEYADAQTLEIAYPDAEAEIYYTTDGSEPVNEETATCHRYVGAIALNERPDAQAVLGKIPTSAKEVKDRQGKAYGYYEPTADQPYINVIRARAFKNGVKSAGEAFGTWLIGQNGTRHSGLRVVSLQTNPDNLFSDSTGIMVPGDIYNAKGAGSHSVGMPNANYFQSGRTWEREVNLELFEPDRTKGFNQRVGVRVRGNWSRAAAKKSLTVYNRAEYGAKNLKYQLFNDEPDQKKFKRFLLRNGGNDWYEGNIRDAIAQGVFRGYLRTCSQGNEPSVLYINGEYWGIYNIRHGYAKQHFENWCGADGDNLDWIKLESSDSGRKYEVQEGDIVEFLKLRQYFRNHDFTTDEELAKAQEMIDFDDMIDYHLVHIFYGNADWISNNNNVGYWRERKPGAKWRFQLYDVDSIMGLTGGDGRNVDGIGKALGGSDDKIPPIFKKLSQNVKFQKMFVNRFADLLNTALKPEVTQGKLAALATKMRPEAARNVARWENMTSVDAWENHISRINDFYQYRPAIQIEHLKSHFPEATGEMHKLALSKNGEGEIQLNTIESGEGEGKFVLPFEGDYFELTPVTLTAKPAKGMSLEKWVVNGEEYSTEPTIELELTANTSVEATFIGTPLPEVPTRWENTNVVERVTLPPDDYEFANANFAGGIDLEEGDYKFKNDGGSSVNSIASLNGPLANVTFTGKGRMNITGGGDTTLFSVHDLIVLNGVFAVDFTSTVEEVAAVTVARNFLLDEKGKVAITLDGVKPRGIELSNKKMSADFAGGSFTATLKGAKASAFKFKGSDKVTLSGGTMNVTIEGTGAKVLDGGTIVFKDGYVVNVNGTETAENATVFEAGKTLMVDGGVFDISVPGAGSQIFTTADDPEEKDLTLTINGGTFNLLAGDDCVKSAGNDAVNDPESVNMARNVVINGGNFYGMSLGNDVIDSNGDIQITGGNILAYTMAVEDDGNGSTGLDVNTGRAIEITGGNVIAIGGPNSSFHCEGGAAYTANGLTASDWSDKFVELDGFADTYPTHVWAKLPEIGVDEISVFFFTPGIDPTTKPSVSTDTPPVEYATGFHDLYLDVIQPGKLVITKICARCQPNVPEAKDLGWIELQNVGGQSLELSDYKVYCVNRGKKLKLEEAFTLPAGTLGVGETFKVWTSESPVEVLPAEATPLYAKKINQKKYPMVRLYKAGAVQQTVLVPVDLADEVIYDAAADRRPTISPLYGVKDAPDPWQAFDQAKIGENYTVTLPILPADMSDAEEDQIKEAHLIYQIGFDEIVTCEEPMTKSEAKDKMNGWTYTGTIPGSALTKAGELVRFAVAITDKAGRTFRAPRFQNPDDGYEWYGTIVEPTEGMTDKKVQTFYLFADDASLIEMDKDVDSQDTTKVPYNARVGIYDALTGLYYDNVRIDLRGNTTARFPKKSHGLRFSKAQPLSCVDPVTGTEFEEIRKTSFVADYMDPAYIRQSLSFWLFREAGAKAPYDYPVKLNLNGEFYQLAWNSNRFTDELIEDVYGLDPLGYGFKNCGTIQPGHRSSITTEKKTPDDGVEVGDVALAKLYAFENSLPDRANYSTKTDDGENSAKYNAVVVKTFDLPAWLNYMAMTRITSETDDTWSNISLYYNINNTGTWMPLAYDCHLSFGAFFCHDTKEGVRANADYFKSHPFYGGWRVPAHNKGTEEGGWGGAHMGMNGGSASNSGLESIYQSPKFRRLYLRRLRTLMDTILEAPGTTREDSKIGEYIKLITDATADLAAADREKWPFNGMFSGKSFNFQGDSMNCWPNVASMTPTMGIEDLWNNYIVPRRVHLFETHSVHNTKKGVGYNNRLSAGIPDRQRTYEELKDGITAEYDDLLEAVVIRNTNAETIDLSGWTLAGPVEMTLPAGTILDQALNGAPGEVYVTLDRKATIDAMAVTDQVVVGNGDVGEGDVVLTPSAEFARALLTIDNIPYQTLVDAFAAVRKSAGVKVLVIIRTDELQFSNGVFIYKGETVNPADFSVKVAEDDFGVLTIERNFAGGMLYLSEICPKPSDLDPNGLESGWVEFVNGGDNYVDMGEYRLIRVNRSKKTDITKFSNLPAKVLAPGERFVVYTSERYPESAAETTAFVKGEHSERDVKEYTANELFEGSKAITVWPDKVNPKKFSFMRLYKMTSEDAGDIVDTVVIPSDLPEGKSIVVGFAEEGEATKRWVAEPTKGAANATDGLVAIGPNVGPLYEIKGGKKTEVASEFARKTPMAKTTEDYTITLAVNGVMSPTEVAKVRDADNIKGITLVYRFGLDGQLHEREVDMNDVVTDAKAWGDQYTVTIPQSELAFLAPGSLIQWKTKIVDNAGNIWTSPSFMNKDDGYEWYGTIVEPSKAQMSSKLNTFHIFGTSDVVDRPGYGGGDVLMNKDYADSMGAGARVCIYDQRTEQYYDYVRIDLRGNTSGKFIKKSHGLRFAKTHPLQLEKTYIDPVSGTEVDELRKTSFISEFADPTYMRQMLAFWLLNDAGSQSPFDYPVRLNINGEFYQLGFHSERFTEDLIEKTYGLDQFGYGYKNIGTFAGGSTAGSIEKKTPDDGNEYDNTFLNAFCNQMNALGVNKVTNDVTGSDTTGLDNAALTKFVVEKFDLASWFNYLAATRITHENDDVWANISGYCDDPTMLDGGAKPGSTGTWMPLAYDMNLSFGQWMTDGDGGNKGIGLRADDDYFKSHPFYGGNRVRQWKKGHTTMQHQGNRCFEAVWQSSKFRRLYLRRLRTLMDKYLVELPAETTIDNDSSPIMTKIREFRELLVEDSVTDRGVWGYPDYNNSSRASQLYDWAPNEFPRSTTEGVLDIDEGIRDLWENYLQPRRAYLFEKHTANGKDSSLIGYATEKLAGIPDKQSDLKLLRRKISAVYDETIGAVIIRNANIETVDLSGFVLTGPVNWTLPSGTILDQATNGVDGELYVTADRRATVAAMTLVDQVVVGNGEVGEGAIELKAADGIVIIGEVPEEPVVIELVASRPDEALPTTIVELLKDMPANTLVVLKGKSEEDGFIVDYVGNFTFNNLHLVVESGEHSFRRSNGGATTQFANGATPENPTILVKDGATLNLCARDLSGWNCAVDTTGIIRVNDGGTLNLRDYSNNTFYFNQQFYLDAGADVHIYCRGDHFRLNGGVNEMMSQIYMPPSEGGVATITIESDSTGLKIAADSHPDAAFYIEDGSTLVINGNVTGSGRSITKYGAGKLIITGTCEPILTQTLLAIDGAAFFDWDEALRHIQKDGSVLTILDESRMTFKAGVLTLDGKVIDLAALAIKITDEEGALIIKPDVGEGGTLLYITEIMPKPTDSQNRGTLEGMDPNGLESGWVELRNDGDKWVDLKDYRFVRVNRKKATKPEEVNNFPSMLVAPHSFAVFYTSERYSNSADQTVSAFETGTFDGQPMILPPELHGMMVWGDKVNPKKSPFVRLYYVPGGDLDNAEVIDTVIVPSDLPEGASIIVGRPEEGKSTARWICEAPTRGAENPSTDGLVRIGPNVGPLYEGKKQKKHDSASEFARNAPPANPDEDYVVTFSANPVLAPTKDIGTVYRDEDKLASIVMVVRTDLDDNTLTEIPVDFATKDGSDTTDWGDTYTATIPKSKFPARGHLIQWKFKLVVNAGSEWTSPSYHNPDDGYEWYGTIVEPTAEQMSEKLTTWHMFAEAGVADVPGNGDSNFLMNKDSSDSGYKTAEHPNGARVAIYDSSTSNYYDYVRVDLRGNTTASFKKKSHGLRFAKAHPLTTKDCVTGEDIEEVRKTSLIAEWSDPSFIRQMTAFWLWRKAGNNVPYDFPIRCNMNGKFYQLAFCSERFTDELIEDIYGLDKFGYSYKSVGTLESGGGTTAGGIEKKTPDDEDEKNITVLQNELRSKITAAKNVPGTTEAALSSTETDPTGLDNAALTKTVVERFDLAAWINYLASARITQEADDVWGNLCAYYDNPTLLEGVRGTGTWMPLGYDFNLSFGQHYKDGGTSGMMATEDWFKSHPFYGGWRVRCWNNTQSGTVNYGNCGFESVLQSSKFRRLFLRRLRTLMDTYLGEPNESETLANSERELITTMRAMVDMVREDAAQDRTIWGYGTGTMIDDWGSANFPKTVDDGLKDIYDNYIVPRREHLYVTHSVTNTAKAVGYGSNLNAGIPLAQSAIADLRAGITAEYDATIGAIVIKNANEETIDLSDWELSGPVSMTIPAGTVLDQAIDGTPGEVYVTADRRATVAAMTITDQIVVGNGDAGTADAKITLTAADGTKVIFEPSPAYNFLRLHSFDGIPPTADGDTDEWIALTNCSNEVELDLAGVKIVFLKNGDPLADAKCVVTLGAGTTLAPSGSLTLKQGDFGWKKITNGKLNFYLTDADGMSVQSLYINQKDFTNYYGEGGPGGAYYLQATTFAQDSETFVEVAYPASEVDVKPGEQVEVEANSAEEAVARTRLVVEVPEEVEELISIDDYKEYFTREAKEIEVGKYKVSVVLNPEIVPEPKIGSVDEETDPLVIKTLGDSTIITIGIVNAKIGLWYGFEATGDLKVDFENDCPSFKLATDPSEKLELKSTSREGNSSFFRTKVSEIKPEEPPKREE